MRRSVRLGAVLLCVVGAGASAGASSSASAGAGASAIVHPKRGIASSRYLASDPSKLSQLGATWAYNWSATAPPEVGAPAWVPMVWGPVAVNATVVGRLRAMRRSGRARYLLGFNEPDSPSQSNLAPRTAAALWPQLERTGLILGSPATVTPSDGWLSRFMALARRRHLRVDFIALHYYQDFTNPRAVSELRRQLVSIHAAYRRPIWITEIGAIDLRSWHEPMLGTPTDALAAQYMRELFAMLDGLPFVKRYAWFTDDCWNDVACRFGSLFASGGRLTLAGSTFATAP